MKYVSKALDIILIVVAAAIILTGIAVLWEAATAPVEVEFSDISYSVKHGLQVNYEAYKDFSDCKVINAVATLMEHAGIDTTGYLG